MIRQKISHFLQKDEYVIGLLFALATFFIMLFNILSPNRFGTVDTGQYEFVMEEASLSYRQEDISIGNLTYDRVIENYEYKAFDWEKLFAPSGIHSITYFISIIRILTRPFGLGFSTVYLYVFYAVIISVCIGILLSKLSVMAGRSVFIAGAGIVLLFSDKNLLAFLNSLYPVGTVITSGLLLLTSISLLAGEKKRYKRRVLFFLICADLFLSSSDETILFIPFILIVSLIAIGNGFIKKYLDGKSIVLFSIFLLAIFSSAGSQFASSRTINETASSYEAAFQGFLLYSDDSQRDLAELGLGKEYGEDVGKSFYLDSSEYKMDPRDEKIAEELSKKLNFNTILGWYVKHPDRLINTAKNLSDHYSDFFSERIIAINNHTKDENRVTRKAAFIEAASFVLLDNRYSYGLILSLILFLVFVIGYFLFSINSKEKDKKILKIINDILIVLAAILGILGLYFMPLYHVLITGGNLLDTVRIPALAFYILLVFISLPVIGSMIELISKWMMSKSGDNPEGNSEVNSLPEALEKGNLEEENLEEENTEECINENIKITEGLPSGKIESIKESIKAFIKRVIDFLTASKRRILLVSALLLTLSSVIVIFAKPHAACVNNGDFGRMMDQVGLIWEGNVYFDLSAQEAKRVIETYAYRRDFNPAELTIINPKYSLIYPASVIRGICSLIKQPFNTWYLEMLMTFLMIVCILSILSDLYKLIGKWTMLTGILMAAIFTSENYLLWFNSLFGESSIILGVFMFAAATLHLACEDRDKPCYGWIIFMLFSGSYLVCAKAQMLLSLPMVILLCIILSLYHIPFKVKQIIPYTLIVMIGLSCICYKGYRVYMNNADVSERQTLWQSVFYGALMVSDNPVSDMQELGIDVSMAPDIGKIAYMPDEDYVISPNSEECDEAFYNNVSTIDMVLYYLKHPKYFLTMLNHASKASEGMYTGFRAYAGDDYTKPDCPKPSRFSWWVYFRPFIAFRWFAEYVILYAVLLFIMGKTALDKGRKMLYRMPAVVFIIFMMISAIEFPLSVMENGFADNQKQMFGFAMIYDFLFVIVISLIAYCVSNNKFSFLCGKVNNKTGKIMGEENYEESDACIRDQA